MQESFVFTISAAGDKSILSRILMLFSRRNIAFENLIAHRPDDLSQYSFRIEANTSRHWAEQITKELRKIIGVGYAAFSSQEEVKQAFSKPAPITVSQAASRSKQPATA